MVSLSLLLPLMLDVAISMTACPQVPPFDQHFGEFLPKVVAGVGDPLLDLASDEAAWMTGVTLPVDGGRQLTCAR